MKKIIENFSDQDLYSWSVDLFWLNHFSELEIEYSFIDRNNTTYPEGFADRLMEQVNLMDNLSMSDDEISGLKLFTESYFPSWYYIFLKGLKLDSKEVFFTQDKEGHLHGKITGPAWRVVFWEQLLLATISEMYHSEIGDTLNIDAESNYTKEKCEYLLRSGCDFADMGTRRRFSKEFHERVVYDLCEVNERGFDEFYPGRFLGTSNLWLAVKTKKDYSWMKCIGTMSHQVISVCAAIYGPREANKMAMRKWQNSYGGNLGIYLPDCLGTDAFYSNFSREDAKLWDGYRIDSGDNITEFKKLLYNLNKFKINPREKGCVFSNGLKIEDAINIHKEVSGLMKDSYGLGTILTCGLKNTSIKPSNIVIKATACRLTPNHPWLPCVKLSCDIGKATGDEKTIESYKTLLGY